nr:hypothetical protein [Tanacetum cinerariifolium]
MPTYDPSFFLQHTYSLGQLLPSRWRILQISHVLGKLRWINNIQGLHVGRWGLSIDGNRGEPTPASSVVSFGKIPDSPLIPSIMMFLKALSAKQDKERYPFPDNRLRVWLDYAPSKVNGLRIALGTSASPLLERVNQLPVGPRYKDPPPHLFIVEMRGEENQLLIELKPAATKEKTTTLHYYITETPTEDTCHNSVSIARRKSVGKFSVRKASEILLKIRRPAEGCSQEAHVTACSQPTDVQQEVKIIDTPKAQT